METASLGYGDVDATFLYLYGLGLGFVPIFTPKYAY